MIRNILPKKIYENIYGWIFRFSHMFIIAMYHLIIGFGFAVLNNYLFLSVDDILNKYDTTPTKLYFEVIGWIILETTVLLAEIYIIRNTVKILMNTFHRYNPDRKLSNYKKEKLLFLVRAEQSGNIMIGYTVYLFNYKLNQKFAFLMQSITNSDQNV